MVRANPPSSSTGKTLQVLQFTDTHLLEDDGGQLRGTPTWRTFQSVIEHARREMPEPDFILATGDLSQDGPPAVYRRLREHLDRMKAPVYVVPGNHDDPVSLAETFPAGRAEGEQLETDGVDFGHANHGRWLMVLLSTLVPGMQYGTLSAGELARLDALLRGHPGSHALLCLHHHPVPFGRAGIDSIGVRNAEDFFSVVDRHPNVRGIVWGHIHNTFEARRGRIVLLGTPSTCFQFDATSEQISPAQGPPAYRRLALAPDGGIHSRVVWVSRSV